MSPDIPEQADPQRAIDAAQRELDAHDGNADGKIDHGAPQSDADREKLTAIYIGKVNDMQGRIADAKRTVEIGKNAQSPHWQELERACTEAETGLLEKLATVDPKTMHETVNAFDADVAQLLEKFSTVHPEQKEQTSVGMAEHARTLLTTLGLPSEAQNAMLDEAIAQYGEEGGIRAVRESVRDRSGRVQTQIDALNGNVITLMQRIVDETKGLQYGWRDNLKDLLRLSANMQTVGIASGAIDNVLPDRFSVADKGIQALVDEIKRVRPEIQTLSEQQQVIDGIAAALDITLAVGAADGARLAGRTEESDRRMTQLLEKYGTGLRGTDATRAMQSAMRLRDQKKLSPIEEAMLFDDPRSPQTLKKAIEQKLSESTAADVLDQVRAKQTFRAGTFEPFDKKGIYFDGKDVSGALGIGSKTILTYSNGRSMTVIATPQAQKVLESIPGDREPVLLRPVTSMVIGTQGVGRGMQSVLRCPPSECIIAHTDIGFVDGKGNIVRDDGVTPVDLGNSENRAMIEAQIQNQKGFHLERYQPKLPLRTAENKSYPNGLYTIKTQSGLSVEGVTVDRHAIDFVNAEPPEGQMLVLKRIPRPIVLRAPDSEQYGRGSRLYQRVLQTDIVSKEDLAYAKIDGDSLVTRDLPKKETDVSVSPPKEESTEVRKPVAEIEKEQEEKTRDIERVLDRNPAILGVKRSASTIQQTVGHLQKFLEAGQIGSARDSFVKFAREEARPTLEMLQDPRLKRDVEEAKVALRALKGVNGVALGGLEQKIDEQLKALDGFTAMLNDAGTIDLFKTITDESRFSADTWANFCMNELPVIVASITVACLLAAAVVLTMGGATPLIAVSASTFFLTSAGATALGTVAGAELGKEAVHAGHKYLDSRVRSGEATFTERSRFGKYAEGQKEIDEKTGTYRDRELFGDVLNPLAQEFSQAFIVTLGTMGIGNVVGGQLSKLLQNSKIVERLAARSDVMQSVVRRLSQLNGSKEALGKAANLKEAVARALKSLPKEIGEEFGDEAQEHVLETFLNQLDVSLAAADAVDGKLGLGTLTGVLLAIAKNVKIGRTTINYHVRGRSPEALAARTQAIRAEAEGNGAIVTDLGQGVLTIRHPVSGADGNVTWETVQMEPEITENATNVQEVELPMDQAKTLAFFAATAQGIGEQQTRHALKEFMKTNNVDSDARIQIAETLLLRTLEKNEREAILNAHNLPGNIDELSSAELRAKTEELSKGITDPAEQRLLIEAGICGAATLSRPPVSPRGTPQNNPASRNVNRQPPKPPLAPESDVLIDNVSDSASTTALEAPALPRTVVAALESVGSSVERPKDYPQGVDLHLDSHHALVESLVKSGELSPEIGVIAHAFVEHHDLAYSDAELDLGNAEHRTQLLSAFKENALASDPNMTDSAAARLAEQALEFVSQPDNQKNYLIRKVILHGSGSVVPTARRLQEAGMTAEQAQGFAMLFAAHHPGYPISMVQSFVLKDQIPAELRPILLIDTKEGGDPDGLRAKIAERGGELLGISPEEAKKIAAVGYALDRITPARRMETFTLNDDGSYSWTGGETSKKYPLIVTNQKSTGDFTLAKIYGDTIVNVQREEDAAVETARTMGVQGLDAIIQSRSSVEIARTADIQSAALEFSASIEGFSGHLNNIDADISIVEGAYRKMQPDDVRRDACGYLLGTLKSIQSNPNSMKIIHDKVADALLPDARSLGVLAARNRSGAGVEVTQVLAEKVSHEVEQLAKEVKGGDPQALATYIEQMGRGGLEKARAKENQELREEGKKEFASVEDFVSQKLVPKFLSVLENIDAGRIGLGTGQNYIGKSIRDLQKFAPGMDMEVKQALARRLHTAAAEKNPAWRTYAENKSIDPRNVDQYVEWLLSPDTTIEGGRPAVRPINIAEGGQMFPQDSDVGKRLTTAIDALAKCGQERDGIAYTAKHAAEIVDALPDPIDRAILTETARILEAIVPTAGAETLKDADRWVILEFSARYLQEFRAAQNFTATPEQLLKLVTDNAVNLAHQDTMDYMTLVGSSHGALHVLRGNSQMLVNLFDQLGFTPEQRILALQATFDHDMGYTKRTLVGSTPKEGVFDASKDHPLESTLYVESRRKFYRSVFGNDGYTALRNAVLDHSDAVGNGQFADGRSKIDRLTDQKINPFERVGAAVALVDCLATVNNLKTSPLFRDNPEIFASLSRCGEIYQQINTIRADTALSKDDRIDQADPLLKEVGNLRASLIQRIDGMAAREEIDSKTAKAYHDALNSTMEWESKVQGDFAINLNVSMLCASVSPQLRVDSEGMVHVQYTIDPRGQQLIEKVLGPEKAAKLGVEPLLKAAEDFGGLSKDDEAALKDFVAKVRSGQDPGVLPPLRTSKGLVMEFDVGQDDQYEKVANVVETNLRINAIRDFSRQNLDKIMKGEPLTLQGTEHEITDAVNYTAHAKDAVRSLITELPTNYVIEQSDGSYVPAKLAHLQMLRETEAMQQQDRPAAEIAKKWAEFCDRIYRSAGSDAPVSPAARTPSRRAAA